MHVAYENFIAFFCFRVVTTFQYGTFPRLCERFLNKKCDIRTSVGDFLSTGKLEPSGGRQYNEGASVLLIDEVDVFFEKDFYGSSYMPYANLRDEHVWGLVKLLWRHWLSESKVMPMKAIKVSDEYSACETNTFKGYPEMLDDIVQGMRQGLRTHPKGRDHDYDVQRGRIAYKEQDGMSFKVSYGFKTVFAYMREHEEGNVTEEILYNDVRMGMSIRCGEFSYAAIPNQFGSVMGVTGTLHTLSKPEKELLRDEYDLTKCTYVPSVYGKGNLVFTGNSPVDVQIAAGRNKWYLAIKKEMRERLKPRAPTVTTTTSATGETITTTKGGTGTAERAVLVFFETTEALKGFFKSPLFDEYRSQVIELVEATSSEDKPALIQQAVQQGAMTLASSKFGRGTDFKCYDDEIKASGGIHVIQTFVSEKLSEETQIKGRTARQGDEGSYSMVLDGFDLEKFDIKESSEGHSSDTRNADGSQKMFYDEVRYFTLSTLGRTHSLPVGFQPSNSHPCVSCPPPPHPD